MPVKLTEKEIEKLESFKEDYVCEILDFKIFVTPRQYKVTYPDVTKKDGKIIRGPVLGYFSTLTYAIEDIKDQLVRNKIKGSETLDEVMKRMEKFNIEFKETMKKLKVLEDETSKI